MTKPSDERQPRAGASRLRGVRDIRTLGALRKPSSGLLRSSLVEVRVGTGRVGTGRAGRKPAGPAKAEAPEQPRAWVFVKRPRFSRHQGMLLVDHIAEPEVDIFEEGQSLVVLAELPGARHEDIEVHVNGDVLVLSTTPGHDDRRRYYREILLPFTVSSAGIQRAFRNGVLELELERAPPPPSETRRKQP